MKVNKRKPLHWLWLTLFSLNTVLSLILRPFAKPSNEVVLYGHKLNGNLKAIYKECENHKSLNLHYLSMDYHYCQKLKNDGVRAVWGGSWHAIVLLARTRIIVSDHGLHCLILLLKFTAIKFIDVWHGIPFKGFEKSDFKVQRLYDEVWVTSPYMAEVYEEKFGFKRDRIKIVGYARTDKLVRQCHEGVYELREQLALPTDNTPIVLFAPTWAQDVNGRSIFPFGCHENEFYELLSSIAEEYKCIFLMRRHINSKAKVHEEHPRVKEVSFDRFTDTEMLLLISDVLIYDWSSIAFDFLLLNRPAIYLDVPPPFKKGFSLDASYRFGAVAENMTQLKDILKIAICAPEFLIREEKEIRSRILCDVYANYADGNSSKRGSESIIRGLRA